MKTVLPNLIRNVLPIWISFLIFIVCIYNYNVYAQTFTNYTAGSTPTTLCSRDVYSIAIDTLGNKWFGTGGGVSKFDGINWTTYTTANGLASNYVYSIAIDAKGNKWFGTSGGVSKFDGSVWTTYNTANGLANNYVNSIAIDSQGNKWFGTNGGVSKFDGITWTTYTKTNGLADNHVYFIAIDTQGNNWFGTLGVSKFDGSSWTTFTTANGLPSDMVLSIAIDAQSNKWFGTSYGVSKFDGSTWTNYLVGNMVYSIVIDTKGNIWFGTDKGVSKFDGSTWTTYTTTNGLAENHVISIAIDAQDNKWFGTWGGVSELTELPTSITVPSGTGTFANAYQIATPGNLEWLSTTSSVWVSGKYFIQTADIDASATSTWNGGKGFSPIGNPTNYFYGNYDGQGHTISGIYSNRSADYQGLFGVVSGKLKNLGVINVNVNGSSNCGGLAGAIDDGTEIINCRSTGSVTGLAFTGGLIGGQTGSGTGKVTVTDCSSAVAVKVNGKYVGGSIGVAGGGLIGTAGGIFTNCSSSGSVIGSQAVAVGGLFGFISGNATNCSSSGSVIGSQGVGGLCGMTTGLYGFTCGNFTNCNSTGSVKGYNLLGGLIGSSDIGGITNHCLATGIITVLPLKSASGSPNTSDLVGINLGYVTNLFLTLKSASDTPLAGGLIGVNKGTVTSSFWNTSPAGQPDNGVGTGKTSAELQKLSTYIDAGWDFSSVWGIVNGVNNNYPTLICQVSMLYQIELSAPVVTTQAVSNITSTTTATGNGNITMLGVPNPISYGICWNTTGMPTVNNNLKSISEASSTGAFTAEISGLAAYTTYYVRAFATNSVSTVYGDEVNFATGEITGIDLINSSIFSLFPNPANDRVSVNLGNSHNTEFTLNLYNDIGVLVKSELLRENPQQINIGDLSNGIYLVSVKSKDFSGSQKLIIQRH
ncbi:MAG: two-component regulator propeller domain-containing protein [Bacteroidales bacterium]|nr:two-component regulator propeller domain-containing protein [Bacteroidales bacterium]